MSDYVWGDSNTQFFYQLQPHLILDCVELLGFKTTGRCLTLNSMENRVYEVEIETEEDIASDSDRFVIAKFYRPGRWSKEQILDEHEFMFNLEDNDISVVAPLRFDGNSLFTTPDSSLFFALFPKKGGRMATDLNDEELEILGRMLARMHNIGSSKKASHRLSMTPDNFGMKNLDFLLETSFIPIHLKKDYEEVVKEICRNITPLFEGIKLQRVHGDCHWGNIIKRENLYFIDFDDMVNGPCVQDIWLAVPGEDEEALMARNKLLNAYESMRELDDKELKLIEPLRALRFIHFSAWIAKRWEDEAFKRAFVHFESEYYWQTQIFDLQTQLRKIQHQNALGTSVF